MASEEKILAFNLKIQRKCCQYSIIEISEYEETSNSLMERLPKANQQNQVGLRVDKGKTICKEDNEDTL
ncbi:hypothetical protein VNO77_16764 [Canavalia gladiata]|uniref:Uncharacterized protein n=1 Tax=Canavalia gladiata TaxID=3824 RepID=A0AAN9QI33_CANGL